MCVCVCVCVCVYWFVLYLFMISVLYNYCKKTHIEHKRDTKTHTKPRLSITVGSPGRTKLHKIDPNPRFLFYYFNVIK